MTNPYPGQVVYRSYSPQRVGTIMEVIERSVFPAKDGRGNPCRYAGEPTGEYKVKVQWANKEREETVESTWSLRDYEALVYETERKAVNHRKVLERVRAGETAKESES